MRILFVESDRELREYFGAKLRSEFKGTIDIVPSCKAASPYRTKGPMMSLFPITFFLMV